MSYQIGQRPRLSAAITDINGNPVDPTTLTLEITDPLDAKTTYIYGTDAELIKDSTGNYHADMSIDKAGIWIYRFAGTGAAECAMEDTFLVERKKTS